MSRTVTMNAGGSNRLESLNKENYDTWKMQMQAVLVKNNAWKYVNGKCARPDIVPNDNASLAARDKWDEEDEKARSDIILSIHPSELKQIKGCHTSGEVWAKLEGIYQSKGPARKATLLKRLALQKMADGDNVREHMRTFFDAVDKLQEMQVEINSDLLAILLLYSLPSRYENFRCAIESRDNLPDPEALRVKIIEESDARGGDAMPNAMVAGHRANERWKPKSDAFPKGGPDREKPKFKCFRCGKIGHKASECFSNKNRKQSAKRVDAACFFGASSGIKYESQSASANKYDNQSASAKKCENQSASGKADCGDRRRQAKAAEGLSLFLTSAEGTRGASRANVGPIRSLPAKGGRIDVTRSPRNTEGNRDEAKHIENAKRGGAWCLDSGCTSHICMDANEFSEIKIHESGRLNLASSASTEIHAKGTVSIATVTNGRETTISLQNTLHVPDLRTNLLSVSKITDRGYDVIFKRDSASIVDKSGNMTLAAKRIGGLYYVEQRGTPDCKNVSESNIKQMKPNQMREIDKWHRRLGHLNVRDLMKCARDGTMRGLNVGRFDGAYDCEVCAQGKLTRYPFPKRSERVTELLELIHSDVCGPMRVESNGRAKYFVTFIDDCTKWCEVRTINKRSDVFKCFVDYKAYVETATGRKIKYLQTDNGTEYLSTEFNDFLRTNGIQRRLTVKYNPEQNGTAERKNRTLMEMVRCLLAQSGLPATFWAEAVVTANYIRNRCPTRSLEGMTPYEKWRGWTPNVNHLREFGCPVYCLNRTPGKGKLEAKAKKGIFVGYSDTSKGYRIWLPDERRVEISRDVKFLDSMSKSSTSGPAELITSDLPIHSSIERKGEPHIVEIEPRPEVAEEDVVHEVPEEEEGSIQEDFDEEDNQEVNARRGRGRPRIIRTGLRGRPRKAYSEANAALDEHEDCFSTEIPLKQAVQSPDANEWYEAMKEELVSIIKNDTWDLVKRPSNREVIGSRIVLRNKYDANGDIERRKARIVARGFSQRPGLDFSETYAPVARMSSIRLTAALAAQHGMSIHQIDVTTAYLNGKINEELYMEAPELMEEILQSIVQSRTISKDVKKKAKKALAEINVGDKVCLLNKALYGLRQAARSWYARINEVIRNFGAIPTEADPCVYRVGKSGLDLVIVVYVDDIIVASKDHSKISEFKDFLANEFEIKDRGEINYCLGITFTRSQDGITLHQRGYIMDLLDRFGMKDSKPVATPMDIGVKLTRPEGPGDKEAERLPYRELVGALLYLAMATRPDITHVVSSLSQFCSNYGKEHWTAAKRVLRYLKGTSDIGLSFGSGEGSLIGFSDADWGNCPIDRKSYTGYVFTFNGGPVSWESRKQRTVALSSTEAEYMALTEAAKEAVHLRKMMLCLNPGIAMDAIIYSDNQGALKLADNPVFHSRSKHIDIRHHFVREIIAEKLVRLQHISTEEMSADFLTKGLPRPKHEKCMELIGLRSIKTT